MKVTGLATHLNHLVVGVDTKKSKANMEQGRPQSLKDVRSFLMACQYNAKFAFDTPSLPDSYEEITASLFNLLKKNAKLHWGSEEEQTYSKLIQVMSSAATLRPYNPSKATHFVSDASHACRNPRKSLPRRRQPHLGTC